MQTPTNAPKKKTKTRARQSPMAKTKLGRMQAFLNTMTPTEQAKFRDCTLESKEEPRTRIPTAPPNKKTNLRTNPKFAEVLPSRETSPRISQVLR